MPINDDLKELLNRYNAVNILVEHYDNLAKASEGLYDAPTIKECERAKEMRSKYVKDKYEILAEIEDYINANVH